MSVLARLRDLKATAVVCFNDLIAIGIMKAAKVQGISIPHDLSVIGFDNIFASDLMTPGLTSVAAPLSLLGERATRAVVALINKQQPEDLEDSPAVLPMRLIVRESTSIAPRR